MPSRMLREGIVESRKMAEISDSAKVLFYKLLSVVDDFGRFEADPEMLRRRLYMWETERVSAKDVTHWLKECDSKGLVCLYVALGKKHLEITNFKQGPRSKSKFPDREGIYTEAPKKGKAQSGEASNGLHTNENSCMQPQATVVSPYRIDSSRIESNRNVLKNSNNALSVPVPIQSRFPEWWRVWSAIRGTNHYEDALKAWGSVVTDENVDEAFSCTGSYLASLDSNRGYNPEKFLFDQARGGFRARWPPARAAPQKEAEEDWDFLEEPVSKQGARKHG